MLQTDRLDRGHSQVPTVCYSRFVCDHTVLEMIVCTLHSSQKQGGCCFWMFGTCVMLSVLADETQSVKNNLWGLLLNTQLTFALGKAV